MIWNDPWLADPMGGPPPTPPELPAGMVFRCLQGGDMSGSLLLQWRDLVGTRWSTSALQERLAGAWVALLYDSGGRDPVATCVLRPRGIAVWLLETFVARPRGSGYGTLLARHAVPWVWSHGCRSLAYTWELGPVGLGIAWWRGWLRTAVTYEWGWALRRESVVDCSFCPETRGVADSSFTLPMLIQNGDAYVVVSDSGLGDSWGYVLATAGTVDWSTVFQKGRWRALWYRGVCAPKGGEWRWSGESIIVGVIGASLSQQELYGLRFSPEIVSASNIIEK